MIFINYIIFACFVQISCSDLLEDLTLSLQKTDKYFDNLFTKYESADNSIDFNDNLNAKMEKLVDDLKLVKNTRIGRNSKEHRNTPDENLLVGIEGVSSFNLTNVLDFSVFAERINEKLKWFALTLNSTKLLLCELRNGHFHIVKAYELKNFQRFRGIEKCNHNEYLIFIRGYQKNIIILKLTFVSVDHIINKIQELPSLGRNEVIWRNNNTLHLGIPEENYISVYTWFGLKFEKTQTINVRAKAVAVFTQSNEQFIIASNFKTTIFKYDKKLHDFVRIQTLPQSTETFTFCYKQNYFLILSKAECVILYKKVKNVFVPLQKITKNGKMQLVLKKNIILLVLFEQNGSKIFQFDNKFIELNLKLPNNVIHVRLLIYDNNHFVTFCNRNNVWFFHQPIFDQKKSLLNFYEETKDWYLKIKNKANRIPENLMNCNIPVAKIKQLITNRVNGIGAEEIKELMESYNETINQLATIKSSFSKILNFTSLKYSELHAEYARIQCKSKCSFGKLSISENNILSHFKHLDEQLDNIHLQNVKVDILKNNICPEPKLYLKSITVEGKVNGENFSDFQINVLKNYGDQLISGEYRYDFLQATNASIPLNLAIKKVKQLLKFNNLKLNKLNVKSGDLFLPLNGSSVKIKGKTTVSKVNLKGLINITGHINGSNAAKIAPFLHIMNHLELSGNYTLQRVNVTNKFEFQELLTQNGRSYNKVQSEVLSLNESIPIHLILEKKNVKWNNVIMPSFYQWLPKISRSMDIYVTGTKIARQRIEINKSTFDGLPALRLEEPLCANIIAAIEVVVPNLVTDTLSVKGIKSSHTFNAKKLKNILLNTATNLQDATLYLKKFSGKIYIKNATISNFNFPTFRKVSNVITGAVIAENVKAVKIITPQIEYPFPTQVKNVKAKEIIFVEKINGIDVNEFAENIARPRDILKDVVFANELIVKHLNVYSNEPVDLLVIKSLGYLGPKTIQGKLKTTDLYFLPDLKMYNVSSAIVIEGSIKFSSEPTINNLNHKNISQILNEIWLDNKITTFLGDMIYFDNVIFLDEIYLKKSIKSPNYGSWKTLSNRVLSKSKFQNIDVPVQFKEMKTNNISGSQSASIQSLIASVYDLKYSTLQQNKKQVIKQKCGFTELNILRTLIIDRKINGLNLTNNTHNDMKRIVKGKTIVNNLHATEVHGSNFTLWASLAVLRNKSSSTIKGRKTFQNIYLQTLRTPSISKVRIEQLLTKSTDQAILGMKIVKNNLDAPLLIIDGQVKDIRHKLKNKFKNKNIYQIIKSELILTGSLNVLGNISIAESVEEFSFSDLEMLIKNFNIYQNKYSNKLLVSEAVKIILQNSGVYLESLKMSNTSFIPTHNNAFNPGFMFDDLGYCKMNDLVVFCNKKEVVSVNNDPLGSKILFIKLESFSGRPVILTLYGPKGGLLLSILNYGDTVFKELISLPMNGIVSGSAKVCKEVLWSVINFSNYTLIVRIDKWQNIIKYHLPFTKMFKLILFSNNELLLIRNDGVWKLEGLQGPEQIVNVFLDGNVESFEENFTHYVHLKNGNFSKIFKFIDDRY